MEDLCKYSRRELLRMPGMGLNSINEIEFLLKHYNLKLAISRI
jgi:DNA-directed RNA polymerase alpha subunit